MSRASLVGLAVGVACMAGVAHAEPPKQVSADTSKLDKDGVVIQPPAGPHAKNKLCCGYPVAGPDGATLTYYWLAVEAAYLDPEPGAIPLSGAAGRIPANRYTELYTRDGYFFAHVSERFSFALRVEGSGVLADDRVVNYDGKCKFGIGTCFEELDVKRFPFGRGNQDRPLVPFKSVAVDTRVIPIGEPIYLPELDGLVLPDGTIHDGCVRADDTGGHIIGHHIDFFVVTYENFKFLLEQTSGLARVTPILEEPRCRYLR